FLQQDTYKGDAMSPWTQNLYAYTSNNPVNYTDPTGHSFEEELGKIGDLFDKLTGNKENKYGNGFREFGRAIDSTIEKVREKEKQTPTGARKTKVTGPQDMAVPDYEEGHWDDDYWISTNCYAYIWRTVVDPYNGAKLGGRLEPGKVGGDKSHWSKYGNGKDYAWFYMTGGSVANKRLEEGIISDFANVGIRCEPVDAAKEKLGIYQESKGFRFIVGQKSLTEMNGSAQFDVHFIMENANGTWSHQNGVRGEVGNKTEISNKTMQSVEDAKQGMKELKYQTVLDMYVFLD
ncbi:hypothetical protein LJC20_07055, partial [Eubacteriales bacterium OttesenSCG-928-M02]|nr:hypothetical protein [Eubacteriales bacterium OttesenSCG-928-M02]